MVSREIYVVLQDVTWFVESVCEALYEPGSHLCLPTHITTSSLGLTGYPPAQLFDQELTEIYTVLFLVPLSVLSS